MRLPAIAYRQAGWVLAQFTLEIEASCPMASRIRPGAKDQSRIKPGTPATARWAIVGTSMRWVCGRAKRKPWP